MPSRIWQRNLRNNVCRDTTLASENRVKNEDVELRDNGQITGTTYLLRKVKVNGIIVNGTKINVEESILGNIRSREIYT